MFGDRLAAHPLTNQLLWPA